MTGSDDDFLEKAKRPGGAVPLKDYAMLFGVSPSRVYQMIHSGELPAKKVGRRWFVELSEFGRETLEHLKRARRNDPKV